MEFAVAIVTFFAGIFAEALVGIPWNMPGMGTLLAVSVMGASFCGPSVIQRKNNSYEDER